MSYASMKDIFTAVSELQHGQCCG